ELSPAVGARRGQGGAVDLSSASCRDRRPSLASSFATKNYFSRPYSTKGGLPMGKRGPKSSAAQASPSVVELRPNARPEPPEDLTPEQAAEWRAVVARMPAD